MRECSDTAGLGGNTAEEEESVCSLLSVVGAHKRLRVVAMVPSWIRPEGLNLQNQATKEPLHDYCRQTQSGTTRLVLYKAIPRKKLQQVYGAVSTLKGSQRWSNKKSVSNAATYQVVRSQTLISNYRMEGALDQHIRMLNDSRFQGLQRFRPAPLGSAAGDWTLPANDGVALAWTARRPKLM
jgi:hypothetical protein